MIFIGSFPENSIEMFCLVGAGLKPTHLTLEGLERLKECGEVFLESYTGHFSGGNLKELERLAGKKIHLLCRSEVEEEAGKLAEKAVNRDVCLLVFGSPLTATTHISLLEAMEEKGVKWKVVPAVSIKDFVPLTGLNDYNFGRSCTIVRPKENFSPESFYNVIEKNFSLGFHTFCFLDPGEEKDEALSIEGAIELLEGIEKKKGKKIISETVLAGIARAGAKDMKIKAGSAKELKKEDFGSAPHSLLVCGRLSEKEMELLKVFSEWNGNGTA